MTEEPYEIVFPAIWKGVWAGGRSAIRTARLHGTPLVTWDYEKNEVVYITPDEADRQMAEAYNPFPEDDPGP